MSDILCNIESKVYSLTTYDSILTVYNLRSICFYPNHASTPEFMPPKALEEAYYRTILHFPLLAGCLKQKKDNTIDVVVDKSNLNLPGYRESHSDIHYRNLESAKFNASVWPTDLVPAGNFALADKSTGTIKLATAHIVRLKDNSGAILSLCINHGVSDAYGFYEFLNRWADETRAILSGDSLEPANYCFDRTAINRYLPGECTKLDDVTYRAYSGKSRIADFVARLSPNTRGKVLNFLENKLPITGHVFRISLDKLDQLRNQVLACMPDGARLSSNDLLSAIAYKVHGQAKLNADAKSRRRWISRNSKRGAETKGLHGLAVPCDLRSRLGMGDLKYIGNPLFDGMVVNPLSLAEEPITPKALSDVAGKLREVTSRLTPPYIGSFIDLVNSNEFSTGALLANMLKYSLITLASNISRAGMYGADFGNGKQAFSTIFPNHRAVNFVVMQAPPPSKDILVNFTASSAEMEYVLKNEFWRDLAELVY